MNEIEEKNTNEVWSEERLSELFRILQPIWLKYIKATHLLPWLQFLRPHAGKITKTERKSPKEATELLFTLITQCEEDEKWNKFALALKETDFLSLYKLCSVCDKDDFEFYIQIFELLSMNSNDLNILNLSQGMLQLGSITQIQFEQINLVFQEEGEIAAILEFLSCLPSSLEKWLKDFLPCLVGIGKIDLHNMIMTKGREIGDYKNIDLEPTLNIYRDKICKQVRPQDIRTHLRTHNLFPDVPTSLSPIEEMSKILDFIEKSQVPGKWRSFLDALRNEGYESLHKMLTNEGDDSESDNSEKMEHFKMRLTEILKLIDINVVLLSELRKYKLINRRSIEEIRKKKDQEGNMAAAEVLLECVHRFKYGWYYRFLDILITVEQKDLARSVDPEYYAKVCEVEGKS